MDWDEFWTIVFAMIAVLAFYTPVGFMFAVLAASVVS